MNSHFKNLCIELSDNPTDLAHVHITPITSKLKSDQLDSILHGWDKLGKYGGFCDQSYLPEEATTSVEFLGLESDFAYVWRVHWSNCDSRCLIVLANMMIDAGYIWDPAVQVIETAYNRIEIRNASDRRSMQQYDFNTTGLEFGDQQYPPFAEILRPLVTFEGAASVKVFRRAIIEFHAVPAEGRFDQICQIVDLWSKVARNGYSHSLEDLYTGNSAIENISVDLFDDEALEIKAETFGGSEAAWNSLINVLGISRSEINCIRIY